MKSKTPGKIIKRVEQLPGWFPLPVYSDSLTAPQWHHELAMRLAVHTAHRNTGNTQKAISSFHSLIVDSKYRDKNGSNGLLSGERDLSRAWPVQELSAFDAAYLSALMSRRKTGKKVLHGARRFNRLKRTHELAIKASPLMAAARRRSFADFINDRTERIHLSEVLHGVPLTIDLTQDDETLKLAFQVWLAGAREILGQAKRPIGDKEFVEWKEYGILQVFDLEFWGRLNGLRYSDALLAKMLWPDAEVDAEERLRKVSRKKVNEIFRDWTLVTRFWRQLELSKFLEGIKPRTAKTSTAHKSPARPRRRNSIPLTFG
jgi:Family of unknown function (DUF6387)